MAVRTRTTKRTKFYEDSSSSSLISVAPLITPSAYAQKLADTRTGLNLLKELPPCKDEEFLDYGRIDRLKDDVLVAYANAHGNPANGRWALIAGMLKLSCTTSRRWFAPYRGERPHPGNWVLAETEEEWAEWERARAVERQKLQSERQLREKVERWKSTVKEGPPEDVKVKNKPGQKKKQVALNTAGASKVGPPRGKVKAHNLEDPSPLGFPVVKRNSSSSVMAGKKPPPRTKGLTAVPESSPLDSSSSTKIDHIAKLPDLSSQLPPPSFPSQLPTSTPNPKPHDHPPTSSSPLPFPPRVRKKRKLSLTPEAPSKQPRLSGPHTPQKRLPTLTDILASTKKTPVTNTTRSESLFAKRPMNQAPTVGPLSTLRPETQVAARRPLFSAVPYEDTEEALKSDAEGFPSPAKSMTSIADSDSDSNQSAPLADFTVGGSAFNPPFTSTQRPDSKNDNIDRIFGQQQQKSSQGFNFGGVGATQSQSQEFAGGRGFGYNSQMNVRQELDNVTRYLDHDVDMSDGVASVDYKGWLNMRDTPGDDADV